MKVYVILQKNLKEGFTNIYGIYSKKENAKRWEACINGHFSHAVGMNMK